MQDKTQQTNHAYTPPTSARTQTVVWQEKPIVLIGLMGAGKSTVGRKLAKAMEWPFADSDNEIETAAGCSISDMFSIHGETVFRDLEQRVISRLLSQELMVVATGGGAWMQPKVREIIQQKSLSVWLKADIEVLLERVSKRSHRPLLEQGDKRAILTQLMEDRYPIYAQADIVIDSDAGSQEAVVQRILEAVQAYRVRVVRGDK